MNQYGDNDLVNNPRYQGQSGGTDVRGPEGESRYGAMPMSTGTGNPPRDPLEPIRNPVAYGFKKDEPEGFRYPGMSGAGAQQQNLVQPNAHPSQAGYGSSQLGYAQHQDLLPNNESQNPLRNDFASDQPGYGQPGFGAPSQGQNTASLWPTPAAPPNARRSDLVGQGVGAPREGMVDRAKDAVGMGPNSGTQGYNNPGAQGYNNSGAQGYDNSGTQGYNNPGAQGYNSGNPRREGIVDKAKDAVGMGPNSGAQGYDNSGTQGYNNSGAQGYNNSGAQGYDNSGNPRREGIVDKAKDAVGVGPNSGYNNQSGYGTQGVGPNSGMGSNTGRPYTSSQEYNPNVNHPNEERGFGGGLGQPQGMDTGYDQSQNLGTGYDDRMGSGANPYGQPRREGVVGRMEDKVGAGPNSGYDNRTATGIDAYVHGNHPVGMQDRIQGVNEPFVLEDAGDMNLPPGQHVPQAVLGERRTEPGYGMSAGKLGGHHTSPGTGLGQHGTDYDETRGKRFEDTSGGIGVGKHGTNTGIGGDNYDDTNTGIGTGTGIGGGNYDDTNTGTGTGIGGDKYDTGTGTGIGGDSYDDTNTGTGTGSGIGGDNYDDTNTGTGTGTAPPKKGLMTKIKEKIHHNH